MCVCVRPPFLLFSGGMPRASYGDRHCITVIHSKIHVALDFTSRIIDFFTIRGGPQHTGKRHTHTHQIPDMGNTLAHTSGKEASRQTLKGKIAWISILCNSRR